MTVADRRLNLGCGTTSAPGWVNMDGSWAAWLSRHRAVRRALIRGGILPERVGEGDWPDDVIVRDLRRTLPFPAESFDAIYASHVVEHLYRTDARRLLAECFRILRPGGVLRVVVPDLKAIVDEYAGNGQGNARDNGSEKRGDPCERLNQRLMLRHDHPPDGPLHLRLYAFFSDFHSHKWVYDAPHLVALFREAGFDDAAPHGYLESGIPRIAEVERASRVLDGEGIVVEGTRPSPSLVTAAAGLRSKASS
jgi:SAM-dependent methyltransferase